MSNHSEQSHPRMNGYGHYIPDNRGHHALISGAERSGQFNREVREPTSSRGESHTVRSTTADRSIHPRNNRSGRSLFSVRPGDLPAGQILGRPTGRTSDVQAYDPAPRAGSASHPIPSRVPPPRVDVQSHSGQVQSMMRNILAGSGIEPTSSNSQTDGPSSVSYRQLDDRRSDNVAKTKSHQQRSLSDLLGEDHVQGEHSESSFVSDSSLGGFRLAGADLIDEPAESEMNERFGVTEDYNSDEEMASESNSVLDIDPRLGEEIMEQLDEIRDTLDKISPSARRPNINLIKKELVSLQRNLITTMLGINIGQERALVDPLHTNQQMLQTMAQRVHHELLTLNGFKGIIGGHFAEVNSHLEELSQTLTALNGRPTALARELTIDGEDIIPVAGNSSVVGSSSENSQQITAIQAVHDELIARFEQLQQSMDQLVQLDKLDKLDEIHRSISSLDNLAPTLEALPSLDDIHQTLTSLINSGQEVVSQTPAPESSVSDETLKSLISTLQIDSIHDRFSELLSTDQWLAEQMEMNKIQTQIVGKQAEMSEEQTRMSEEQTRMSEEQTRMSEEQVLIGERQSQISEAQEQIGKAQEEISEQQAQINEQQMKHSEVQAQMKQVLETLPTSEIFDQALGRLADHDQLDELVSMNSSLHEMLIRMPTVEQLDSMFEQWGDDTQGEIERLRIVISQYPTSEQIQEIAAGTSSTDKLAKIIADLPTIEQIDECLRSLFIDELLPQITPTGERKNGQSSARSGSEQQMNPAEMGTAVKNAVASATAEFSTSEDINRLTTTLNEIKDQALLLASDEDLERINGPVLDSIDELADSLDGLASRQSLDEISASLKRLANLLDSFKGLATQESIEQLATLESVEQLATLDSLKMLATSDQLSELSAQLAENSVEDAIERMFGQLTHLGSQLTTILDQLEGNQQLQGTSTHQLEHWEENIEQWREKLEQWEEKLEQHITGLEKTFYDHSLEVKEAANSIGRGFDERIGRVEQLIESSYQKISQLTTRLEQSIFERVEEKLGGQIDQLGIALVDKLEGLREHIDQFAEDSSPSPTIENIHGWLVQGQERQERLLEQYGQQLEQRLEQYDRRLEQRERSLEQQFTEFCEQELQRRKEQFEQRKSEERRREEDYRQREEESRQRHEQQIQWLREQEKRNAEGYQYEAEAERKQYEQLLLKFKEMGDQMGEQVEKQTEQMTNQVAEMRQQMEQGMIQQMSQLMRQLMEAEGAKREEELQARRQQMDEEGQRRGIQQISETMTPGFEEKLVHQLAEIQAKQINELNELQSKRMGELAHEQEERMDKLSQMHVDRTNQLLNEQTSLFSRLLSEHSSLFGQRLDKQEKHRSEELEKRYEQLAKESQQLEKQREQLTKECQMVEQQMSDEKRSHQEQLNLQEQSYQRRISEQEQLYRQQLSEQEKFYREHFAEQSKRFEELLERMEKMSQNSFASSNQPASQKGDQSTSEEEDQPDRSLISGKESETGDSEKDSELLLASKKNDPKKETSSASSGRASNKNKKEVEAEAEAEAPAKRTRKTTRRTRSPPSSSSALSTHPLPKRSPPKRSPPKRVMSPRTRKSVGSPRQRKVKTSRSPPPRTPAMPREADIVSSTTQKNDSREKSEKEDKQEKKSNSVSPTRQLPSRRTSVNSSRSISPPPEVVSSDNSEKILPTVQHAEQSDGQKDVNDDQDKLSMSSQAGKDEVESVESKEKVGTGGEAEPESSGEARAKPESSGAAEAKPSGRAEENAKSGNSTASSGTDSKETSNKSETNSSSPALGSRRTPSSTRSRQRTARSPPERSTMAQRRAERSRRPLGSSSRISTRRSSRTADRETRNINRPTRSSRRAASALNSRLQGHTQTEFSLSPIEPNDEDDEDLLSGI